MYHFEGDNSMELGNEVYRALVKFGERANSRNGPVLRLDKPVSVTFRQPWKRCNFTVGRDANPIFHHMEAVWMLAGRRDVYFPDIFNSKLKNYSDDGESFNAAYGHRIRRHFGCDQLEEVCLHLIGNPESRQAVIQIWEPADLNRVTKDKACNLSMVFEIDHNSYLNMTIFNRSNDAVWGGVTGANPVHFSYFMQYVLERVRSKHKLYWGKMTFVSNNLHVYTELYPHWGRIEYSPTRYPTHDEPPIGPLTELEEFCDQALYLEPIVEETFSSPMLERTTIPMFNYWIARKFNDDISAAYFWIDEIQEPDWQLMVRKWHEARA